MAQLAFQVIQFKLLDGLESCYVHGSEDCGELVSELGSSLAQSGLITLGTKQIDKTSTFPS